jgi:hypothetical protein
MPHIPENFQSAREPRRKHHNDPWLNANKVRSMAQPRDPFLGQTAPTDPRTIEILATELMRLAATLRLHPHNPEIALDTDAQLPALIAILNMRNNNNARNKIPGALIQSLNEEPRYHDDDAWPDRNTTHILRIISKKY